MSGQVRPDPMCHDGVVIGDGQAALAQGCLLWRVGDGEWTGMTRGTLTGVTGSARSTVAKV